MKSECRGVIYQIGLFCLLFAAAIFLAGCSNPEKAKAQHLAQGEAYLKESKFQEASLEFRNAIQIDDNLAAGHWGLARAFEGLERFPEMLEELRKTITKDPNNLEARIKLGNYYLAGSRGRADVIGEAERLAKEILAKDPKNIEGHILMGSVLFQQNQKDKAFEELNHALQLDPSRVESYLSLAKFHIANKQPEKAEELYKKAISVNYNSPVAHTEYGRFLTQSNRPAEAEAELRKAVEVGPNDRTSRFVLASYYLVNRQFDKAEEQYKALAALEPNKPESQVVLADFYAATNRMDDAVRAYRDILAKAPDYMQGRYRLGEILLSKGDTQGANEQIEAALKKDQHDRQALLLRARLHAQGGQADGLKSAIADLNDVLQQEPNSRAALYFLAQYNFSLGLMDQARAFAAELEKNYPDYLPAKLMQVQLALGSGDQKGASTQATDLLARLDKAAPDGNNSAQLLKEIREKTYLSRGTAQLQLRNSAGARADFEAARNTNPNDAVVYNSLALISLAENKPADAINFFETALKVDGTNFDALNGLLTLYARTQEVDKAHARIDQALASFPNVASLHYLKAQAFGFQHNVQSAEAELKKALELDSNYLPAYSALGALYINTKQEDRAIAEYQKIISLRPENSTPYTLIGILEDQRKNYDVAIENYRKAIEKDPNAIIAANNLAWLYAVTGKGNLDEAMRLAQGVVQKNPNVAGFIDTLGWVFYKKNLHTAAVEQLRKAVAINETEARTANIPPSASYHYHLGMALKGKGDREESRRELETAIRLAEKTPFADLEEAKKALASL
ncbi:MAG TPA: tetratricopeptide repeat protein [Pyrinomonadaceae bacterium]|jgi:tetratricopeptide (TPR) repeat protein|nr:tetratricopeptide repeat protein [Pyrinomonadaceae bacterium]